MSVQEIIKQRTEELYSLMVERRRDLHRYPEPGWTEFRTASLVATTLDTLGYDVYTGADVMDVASVMGQPSEQILKAEQERAVSEGADPAWVRRMDGGLTGVMGILKNGIGPTVGMRFDMDSNDVHETDDPSHFENKEGFRSLHNDAMHACGHDGHVTVGLAVAQLLIELKEYWTGTVKFFFQPAEEGVRGAKAMTDKGIADDVDFMLGSHFGLKMAKTGLLAAHVTGFLATSKFDARFTGKPAHAGVEPEKGKNALLAACCAALNLHAIPRHSEGVSRINVGKLTAGSGRNIIPADALLQLETRGITSEINNYMSAEAKRIIDAAAAMYDVKVSVVQTGGAAGCNNTPALADYIESKAQELGIFEEIRPCDFGASEDCSYFIERVQQHGGEGAYCLIGADLASGHHDSKFNFDENAMKLSTILQTATTIGLLRGEHKKVP